MSNRTPTEQDHSPIFREINLSAEVRRMYGVKWNSPELAYVFGDRKFYLKTEDAGIYSGATTFISGPILDEAGNPILDESGEQITDERSGP